MVDTAQNRSMKYQRSHQSSATRNHIWHDKKQGLGLKLIIILFPILALLSFLLRDWLIQLAFQLPDCIFQSRYDIYCPSCGNTRSVSALLHGKLLTSLRYNIIPVLLLIFSLGAYIELIAYSFGKRIRILPRKPIFYQISGILLAVYLIVRNFIPYLTP